MMAFAQPVQVETISSGVGQRSFTIWDVVEVSSNNELLISLVQILTHLP